MNSDLLLLFTRFPQPGKVKTRLISTLGASGAASLHRCLTDHTLQVIRHFIEAGKTDFIICFAGNDVEAMRQMFGSDYQYQIQSDGDLGQRMSAAFTDFLGQGRRRVVLIGSDCPGITEKILIAAFSHLDHYDLVLGPATDGGYYLIGLGAPCPELFQDLPWGTSDVLTLTQARAVRLGLRIMLLEPLTDIDRPEDLPVCAKFISETHE